jgi:DNA-directed RNA polymerase subunit RPC12/RpoP
MSDHEEYDCPNCRTELISCICSRNKMCPRCTFRVLTLPCACPDGLAKWRFQRTDTLIDFIDHMLPPGSG